MGNHSHRVFKSFLLVLLAIASVLQPLQPVFAEQPTSLNPNAQELRSTQDTKAGSTSAVADREIQAKPAPKADKGRTRDVTARRPEASVSALNHKDPSLATSKSSLVQLQVVSGVSVSPTGTNASPAAIKQNLATVDQPSGAFVYGHPITVPPGRNGLQPDLRLTYDSQSTDQTSIFGQGWSLSIPSIERLNKTGAENLYTTNYFSSTMSGDLVAVGTNSYGAKNESGIF